ncbi:hypothetical protein AB733_04910 [Photobacterium swingsii]|uniref:Uncharacterized protein n=1 Tax=Photobacterium swingsii TaxID=680026 RepID=A0A0J8VG40_9GAMM|nr:AAA family ATPase [Photobacterium swingsii]KMV31465.1 hypothetical protein AB733_04910 [Photobacterium swingsii]PSW25019.1 hypothetical protein C9I94_09440 [Photobacterium swingsii]
MDNSKFYYLVGIEGSGKTTVSKQLAKSTDDGLAIQTSTRFFSFLKREGIDTLFDFNLVDNNTREKLVNKFHLEFIREKNKYKHLFLDGHMYVDNSVTGERVNAMATNNNGISNGIIYLNSFSKTIESNINKDNTSKIRNRKIRSLNEIKDLSEKEFQAAEDYCIKNDIQFGVLNHTYSDGEFMKKKYSDVVFLNEYYLPQTLKTRSLYYEQFDSKLSPSALRRLHHKIGEFLVDAFYSKTKLGQENYQVLSMDRSGNYISNGFINNYNGSFYTYKKYNNDDFHLYNDKKLVIIDSVIDSGKTIKTIVESLPESYRMKIHVICLSINVKALNMMHSLKHKVSFHCLGFSNKEDRPTGKGDMGARLYGTHH